MNFKIAFVQLVAGKTQAEQLERGVKACYEAKEKKADLVLFPEMWNNGYFFPETQEEFNQIAIQVDDDFLLTFQTLAKELQMAIGMTFLEKTEGKPKNSVIFWDRKGNEILHYSKVHTCDFDLEKMLSSGTEFKVADLELEEGTVKIGSMICFDREFPESARILMLKGAEVILAPNACPMEINRLSTLRTRAYENMVAVATCNYAKGQPDCNGHSTIFDGVAWIWEEPGVRDMCIFEAPEEEGIYVASIDLDKLRAYREREVMGNKYRHPACYGDLSKQS